MKEVIEATRVFVSHSSKDKERFVVPFAAKLRARGINAWLDKWEMLPGDSLVDKIFEEGLRSSSAFVIVLSSASVSSEWVRKELNVATVQRIENGTKLIPVVLDQCEIPGCLKDTVYEKINDLNCYDSEFERIVASIESRVIKPALGNPPKYIQNALPSVPGLQRQDIAVLKELGDRVLAMNKYVHTFVQNSELLEIASALEITEEAVQESLTVLEEKGMILPSHVLSPVFIHVQLSQFGFRHYLDSFRKESAAECKNILLSLVNDGMCKDVLLTERTKTPVVVTRYVLMNLKEKELLKLSESNMGYEAHSPSPQLRRMVLQETEA